ncbi:MAG: hypothetical protein ACR2HJ_10700 [Fimbriimonadales bacterium]
MEYLLGVLKARGATSVRVVTLLFKPDAFQGTDRPEFIGSNLRTTSWLAAEWI